MPTRRPQPQKRQQQQEKLDEIDINDAIRALDSLALADRRGGKRGALAFWEAIEAHVEGEIDALRVEIRNDEDV